MINEFEVPMFLTEALPEISEALKLEKKDNAYKWMNVLAAFTCKNIQSHNYRVVRRCFKIADKLYERGNAVVKNAVQNVFVYSFTNIFQNYRSERKQLIALIPMTLYSLYIAQIRQREC